MRISNGRISFTVESLWSLLQRQSQPVLAWVLLLLCLSIGLTLELVAEHYRAASNVQSWDPASGLYVVIMFGFGLRYAPVILLVTLTKSILWSLVTGEDTVSSGITGGIYLCLGYYIASFLLLRRIQIDPGLRQLRDVLWFSGVFAIASLVMSIFHITTLSAMNLVLWSDWLQSFSLDWAGEITGVMALAPPLLIFLRALPWSPQHLTLQAPAPTFSFALSGKTALECIVILAASIMASWLAFGGLKMELLEYSYVVFVPVIWTAARRGFEQTTVVVLLINILAVGFAGNTFSTDPLALQFGLLTVTVTGVLLGAYVKENVAEIARRKKLQEELSYKAFHDSLTGLHNRTWLWEALGSAVESNSADQTPPFALLLLDLDRFKDINDSLGHLTGDRLLKAVSTRIVGVVPEGTRVARFGGDEFVVLLDRIVSSDAVIQLARQLCRELSSAYLITGHEMSITTSIGIVFSTPAYESPQDMLRDADIALYEAKRGGKNRAVVFNYQMYETIISQLQLENDLRQAIKELDCD